MSWAALIGAAVLATGGEGDFARDDAFERRPVEYAADGREMVDLELVLAVDVSGGNANSG